MSTILRRLRRKHASLAPSFDARALAGATFRLITAEEKFLGANAEREGESPRVPKIPHWAWRDVTPGGGVSTLLDVYVSRRRDGKLRAEAQGEDARREFEAFVREAREALVERRHVKYVKIYVSDDAQGAKELKALAREMRATLAANAGEEGVTHVVRSDDSADDRVEDGSMWRITETSTSATSGGKTEHRVHYWFYPDSYEQWYAESSLSGRGRAPWSPQTSAFARKGFDKPFNVRARWLRDSHKFNEWMNELDYEFDITPEAALGGRHAWEAHDASLTSGKRARADVGADTEGEMFAADGDEILSYFVTRRRVIQPHPMIAACASQDDGALVLRDEHEDVTKTYMTAKNVRLVNMTAGKLPPNATPLFEREERDGAKPLEELRIPTHSAWFRWDVAHEIERRALPEFFNEENGTGDGSDRYISCRNAMIQCFMKKGRNVTMREVAPKGKSAPVDAAAAARIFLFLEDWGLLNWSFAVDRGVFKVKDDPPTGCPRIIQASDGTLEVKEMDLPEALKTELFDFAKVRATTVSGEHPLVSPTAAAASTDAQFERRSLDELFATMQAMREVEVRFECNACGTDLIGGVFYHYTVSGAYDLCESCFPRGAYPEGHTSGDYVKAVYPDFSAIARSSASADDTEWSPQEVSSLLEAVSQSESSVNWNDVAASVGSKNEEECIKYFVRMPTEDAAIAAIDAQLRAPNGVVVAAATGATLPDPEDAPFATAPNPVIAQLEFLVSMVSPRVAAASAKAALTELVKHGDRVHDIDVVKKANARGLVAAAVQAKILAMDEEHEIRRIVSGILDVLAKKLELKLKYLDLMDAHAERALEAFSSQSKTALADRRSAIAETRDYSERSVEMTAKLHSLRQRLAVEEAKIAPAAAPRVDV